MFLIVLNLLGQDIASLYDSPILSAPVNPRRAFAEFAGGLYVHAEVDVYTLREPLVHLVQDDIGAAEAVDPDLGLVVQAKLDQVSGYRNGLHAGFEPVVPGRPVRVPVGLGGSGVVGRDRNLQAVPEQPVRLAHSVAERDDQHACGQEDESTFHTFPYPE